MGKNIIRRSFILRHNNADFRADLFLRLIFEVRHLLIAYIALRRNFYYYLLLHSFKFYLMTKSTTTTAVAIANSMIGSSMILFPVTFNQTGIIINVVFCVHIDLSRFSWLLSWLLLANCWSITLGRIKSILASLFAGG